MTGGKGMGGWRRRRSLGNPPRENYSLLVMESTGMMKMATGEGFPPLAGCQNGSRLVFSGYGGFWRRKKSVRGATRGPRGAPAVESGEGGKEEVEEHDESGKGRPCRGPARGGRGGVQPKWGGGGWGGRGLARGGRGRLERGAARVDSDEGRSHTDEEAPFSGGGG
ncbi:hypothetical protein CFC21_019211 [Triticum aestivum]|uniref:Uncharacterized protein n=2 Tax=Triticum aestivum TaxID=4565 RepID=A0A3B6B634_WHEAT|nr:hypothetical protein CFC21_019211 [Triticum aestivum]